MVASHLLKSVHAWTDLGYGEFDLWYWRDKEKHEVDFLVTERRRPIDLIEAKFSDTSPSPSLLRLGESLGSIPRLQLFGTPDTDRRMGGTRVVSADRFLANLA